MALLIYSTTDPVKVDNVRFIQPNGKVIPPAPGSRFRGNMFALMTANQRAGLDITPDTPIPNWCSEPLDDSLAVEGLLALE